MKNPSNILAIKNPELAKEWHQTKNDRLTPYDVTCGSSKRAWWKCKNGHEWMAVIQNRNGGNGCPCCSGRSSSADNCLLLLNPELAKEWHPTKNGKLTPANVTAKSNKRVWWKCKNGHEWQAVINGRAKANKCVRSCPYCMGRKATTDNRLGSFNIILTTEWHPTKNGKLTPNDITLGSGKEIWWRCKNGHEWKATIYGRINRRNGSVKIRTCPFCCGRKADEENCLQVTNPKLAKEWHPIKNGDMLPADFTFRKDKEIWWICEKGHEWIASINNRAHGTGCPYCSGRKVCSDNCLQALNPKLANEWHPTRNGNLNPRNVTCFCSKRVWWKCKKGHEWESRISSRSKSVNGMSGCPYCSGHIACIDNCLQTLNPMLAETWHPTKNGKLTPYDVTAGSKKIVWWKCKVGHEWESPVYYAFRHACPYCYGHRVCIDNCLATSNPKLANEWHPTRNGKLTPYDIACRGERKIWWRCLNGHEWESAIYNRVVGCGCPHCNGIVLRGKILCNSIPEAYMYLQYEGRKIKFKHNLRYDNRLGISRYDFYLIDENRYVEVTGFTKKSNYGDLQYVNYLRTIVKKKRFVKNILGAEFEFIQFIPSKEQIAFVRRHQEGQYEENIVGI